MEQQVSKYSVEIRELLLKIVTDDSYVDAKAERLDPIALSEKYKTLINNINGFIVICDYTTGIYEYISEGVLTHLGYDFSRSTNVEMTDIMVGAIKEDHRAFFFATVFPKVMECLKESTTPTSGTDYRYTCSLQLRNRNDQYHWYLVDNVVIEADRNGFPVRTLITCTNIERIKKDSRIYYNITKKNKDGIYEVLLEGTADNRLDDLKLTTRELQIINLISQGNTNKEIADKLFISLNTVQTHRKSIMKKTQCNGTAELTNFAFARGLL